MKPNKLLSIKPFLFIKGFSYPQCSESFISKLSEANYTQISLQPTPLSCRDIEILKSLGQGLARKSVLKAPLLLLGPS